MTVPTKPLPFAVKVPMVAMFVFLFVSRAAPIATSMAVDRPETIGPHPKGRNAVEGGQGEAFLSREEWARSGQGKKDEHGRCGDEIEAKRSDDGLRLDMPNRGRMWARQAETMGTRLSDRHAITAWRRSQAPR